MRSASAFSTVPIVVGDGLGREMGKIILSEDERDVHVNNYCGEKKLQQRGILASCQPAGRSAVGGGGRTSSSRSKAARCVRFVGK